MLSKASIWSQIALESPDQLRQRMAWALAQIFVVAPDDLSVNYTEQRLEKGFLSLFSRCFGLKRWVLDRFGLRRLETWAVEAPRSRLTAVFEYDLSNISVSLLGMESGGT